MVLGLCCQESSEYFNANYFVAHDEFGEIAKVIEMKKGWSTSTAVAIYRFVSKESSVDF